MFKMMSNIVTIGCIAVMILIAVFFVVMVLLKAIVDKTNPYKDFRNEFNERNCMNKFIKLGYTPYVKLYENKYLFCPVLDYNMFNMKKEGYGYTDIERAAIKAYYKKHIKDLMLLSKEKKDEPIICSVRYFMKWGREYIGNEQYRLVFLNGKGKFFQFLGDGRRNEYPDVYSCLASREDRERNSITKASRKLQMKDLPYYINAKIEYCCPRPDEFKRYRSEIKKFFSGIIREIEEEIGTSDVYNSNEYISSSIFVRDIREVGSDVYAINRSTGKDVVYKKCRAITSIGGGITHIVTL